MISSSAIIHPGVVLSDNCIIEDYVIIGAIPKGYRNNELKTYIGNNAIIRSHTVIYAGNHIGDNFQTGNKANIRELNTIGNNVSIGTLSVVEHHIKIGNDVRIHTQSFIPEFTVIENNVWIGPNVVLTNAKYPNLPDTKNQLTACLLKQHSIIGANATVLPGMQIGEYSLIGAGSVVTKNVSPNTIVAGNPAKYIKSYQRDTS
jgi:acetyltransferase-like isoleucine patch superfamily enzyme